MAAVITVGASGCDYTTLDAAVAAAQPGDELRLRTQTFTGVDESISKSLTIRGGYTVCGDDFPALGAVSALEGTGTSNLFTIGGGATTEVELIKLEMTGGGNALFGGAISVLSGATLRLATVDIHNNQGDFGGAIYIGSDSVLEHSGPVTLRDNAAEKGGALAISVDGLADFTTIGFHPVSITGNVALEGGGVYINEGGTLRTDADHELSVDGNQAQAGGGLFAETSATLELIGDQVRSNAASISGGGLFVSGDGSAVATPTILIDRDTEFVLNQAGAGGGIAFGPGNGYQAEVAARVSTNSAVQRGGGMLIAGDGVVDLGFAVINGNSAGTTGGGLQIEDSAVIAGFLSLNSNRAEGSGGGLFMTGLASLQIVNQLIVRGNEAGVSGGGIAMRDGCFLEIQGSRRFPDLLLQANIAETGNGGGLEVQGAFFQFEGALIGSVESGNRAPEGRGGGAYVDTDLPWEILNSRINGNEAGEEGAGIFIAGAGDFVLGGLPSSGVAPSRGTAACDPFDLEAGEYCAEVRGNVSTGGAGAIAIIDEGLAVRELRDLAVIDNVAVNPAAGVLADAPGVIFRNALIARNVGSSAVFVGEAQDAALEHVSLLFNERGLLTGANATIDVDHSMFWGNGSYAFLPGIGNLINGQCNLGPSNHLPDGFSANPRFITTGRGLYRLSDQSPGLDQCAAGLLPADLDGLARSAGTGSDIGAIEGAWGPSDVLLSDSFEVGPLASPRL